MAVSYADGENLAGQEIAPDINRPFGRNPGTSNVPSEIAHSSATQLTMSTLAASSLITDDVQSPMKMLAREMMMMVSASDHD